MKKRSKYPVLISLLAAVAMFFMACDSDDSGDSPSGTEKLITAAKVKSSSGSTTYDYIYFSFETGDDVGAANSATTDWDLRFTAGTSILTNSGETATDLGSGGLGGAAYTGSTDFSADVDVDSLTFETDTKPWIDGHSVARTLTSVICFSGYATGDGLSDSTPYATADWSAYGFYQYDGMPPVYTMTDRVYVVKIGDGSGYAKFQVLSMEYASEDDTPDSGDKTTTYNFLIKYQIIE